MNFRALTHHLQTKLYLPDGGEIFSGHLALSGEPYMPLTAWTARDAPGIEKLSHQGVWDWTIKREIFRYSYLHGQKMLPYLYSDYVTDDDYYRMELGCPRDGRDSLPRPSHTGSSTAHLAVLGLYVPLEPIGLPGNGVPGH